MATRVLELSAVPALVAAGVVYAADAYVVPMLIKNPICIQPSGTTVAPVAQTSTDMIWKLVIDALALYLGIIVGNMVNNAIFRR